MWQRLGSRKISWDFAVLVKIIKKRGKFMGFDPSGDDQQVAVTCLKLITSKPRLTSPSDMSSARVLCGIRRMTAFVGFSDLGQNE
jgi:hypothetical protein